MSSRSLAPELSSAGSSLPPSLPSTLRREHPGSSLPHLVLLQLSAASLLLKHSLLFPSSFTPKSPFTPVSPLFPTGPVSDFLRLSFCFETQLYLKNSLLFCILLLLAALQLFWCLQNSQPLRCLSPDFPLPHCKLIPSATSVLQLLCTLLLSKLAGSGLECVLLSVDFSVLKVKNQHPFIVAEKRSLCESLCFPKSKTLFGNSCVEILLIMWRHKINLNVSQFCEC